MNKLKDKFRDNLLCHLSDQNTEANVIIASKICEEFAIAFFNFMRKEDTQENAEKYFHYTDQDMLNVFKEEYYEI